MGFHPISERGEEDVRFAPIHSRLGGGASIVNRNAVHSTTAPSTVLGFPPWLKIAANQSSKNVYDEIG